MQGGWVNDADYKVWSFVELPKVNGKRKQKTIWCPYFLKWSTMKSRISLAGIKLQPSYEGVTVCDEWKNFMCFKNWMETQPWENMELDKDLIKEGSKIYSPETCCFIPDYINSCLLNRKKQNDLPLGVIYHPPTNKYTCRSNSKILGIRYGKYHVDKSVAHKIWQSLKIEAIKATLDYWVSSEDFIKGYHARVLESIEKRLSNLEHDYKSGIETVKI